MTASRDFATRFRSVARALKAADSQRELERAALPIAGHSATLVHVCALHARERTLVTLLGTWRAANPDGFFTRFPVTDSGTALWLQRILDGDDRLFFLIRDGVHGIVGHAGLTVVSAEREEIEVDNVVRGADDTPRGLMTAGLGTALEWVSAAIAPKSVSVRVLEDNERAVALYRRAGFDAVSRHELRRHRAGACEELRPRERDDEAAPDAAYLRMTLKPH
jgi:RimJ/RimL family protein N-acetyltransferase